MEEKNATLDRRIEEIGQKLDGILLDKKLSFIPSDMEINEIFEIGAENLSKIPSQKLSEYAFLLSRYIVYLQKDLNKKKAIINWAKRRMDYIVHYNMSEYRDGYITSEELKMKAIRGNDIADRLYKFICDEELEIIALSDLTFEIRKMSDALVEISKSKRFQNG